MQTPIATSAAIVRHNGAPHLDQLVHIESGEAATTTAWASVWPPVGSSHKRHAGTVRFTLRQNPQICEGATLTTFKRRFRVEEVTNPEGWGTLTEVFCQEITDAE